MSQMTKPDLKKELKQKAIEVKNDLEGISYAQIAHKSSRAYQTVKETFSPKATTCNVDVIDAAVKLIKARDRKALKLIKQ